MAGLEGREPIRAEFTESAEAGDGVTVTQLKDLPMAAWDSALEAGSPPPNLDEFESNLRNVLDLNALKVGPNMASKAEILGSGRYEAQIQNRYGGDVRAFADAHFPDGGRAQPMEEFRELYRDVFEHIHTNGLGPEDARAYATEQFEATRDAVSNKIDSVMERLRTPEAAPEPAPAAPAPADPATRASFTVQA